MIHSSYTEKFLWKPFLAKIAVIAIPVALQNLLTTTGSMVDTMMLGSLGEKTVGAVGLCAQLSSLMFSCYWGFVGGGMLFMSQFWGAKDDDGIRAAYGITMTFMMSVAVIFTVLTLGFPEFLMRVYTNNEEIQKIGVSYLRVVGFSYPLQILAMAMSAQLRSIEKVRVPLYGAIAAVVSNCFFNYLFIFGKCGFPALGAPGAAVGTIIASFINVAVICAFVVRQRLPYTIEFRKLFRWKKPFIALYFKKCFPIICNEVAMGIANMMINIVMGRQIPEAIAAVAVFRTLEGVVIAFFSGFSNAASILVGTEVGAGHLDSAYRRAKRLVYLCSAIIGCTCLMLFAVHTPLFHAMGLHGTSFTICTGLFCIYALAALIRMGNWTQNDTYRAAGDPVYGTVLEIVFMYTMVLPLVYTANFALHLNVLAVFALCYCDEPIRYVLMQIHLYSAKWIKPVSVPGKAALAEFWKRRCAKK